MRLFFILLSIAYTCIYNVYIFSLLAILKQKSLQEEVRKYKKECFDHHQCNEVLYWTWIPASLLSP